MVEDKARAVDNSVMLSAYMKLVVTACSPFLAAGVIFLVSEVVDMRKQNAVDRRDLDKVTEHFRDMRGDVDRLQAYANAAFARGEVTRQQMEQIVRTLTELREEYRRAGERLEQRLDRATQAPRP